MLRFVDLRWPRVFQRSSVGLVYTDETENIYFYSVGYLPVVNTTSDDSQLISPRATLLYVYQVHTMHVNKICISKRNSEEINNQIVLNEIVSHVSLQVKYYKALAKCEEPLAIYTGSLLLVRRSRSIYHVCSIIVVENKCTNSS